MTVAQKTAATLKKKDALEKKAYREAEAKAYNAEFAKDAAQKLSGAAAKLAAAAAEKARLKLSTSAEEFKDEGTTDSEESQIEKMSKSNPNYGFCQEALRLGMHGAALPPQCQ